MHCLVSLHSRIWESLQQQIALPFGRTCQKTDQTADFNSEMPARLKADCRASHLILTQSRDLPGKSERLVIAIWQLLLGQVRKQIAAAVPREGK
jgi:hypothetical protein